MEDKVQVDNTVTKTVATPSARFESMLPYYKKSRAIIGGEALAKAHDEVLDTFKFSNLLIPFSVNMTPQQYAFYRMEAELPGICAQYVRVLVSGLLRKRPDLVLPKDAPEGAYEWIMSDFAKKNGSLLGFLASSLMEEVTTSRAWVGVSHPYVDPNADLTPEQKENLKPFPVLYLAESIINCEEGINPTTGENGVKRVVVRRNVEVPGSNEFHADILDTVWVHDLNELGQYRIRTYRMLPVKQSNDAEVVQGDFQVRQKVIAPPEFQEIENIIPLANGKPLMTIPLWPFNGEIVAKEPILMPFITREIALYNKVSRRNHLLYGAATFTPIISSDMLDEEVNAIAEAGLGTWIRVRVGETITVLDTPTGALADMDRSIQDTLMEIARMGIRMMAPDVRDQSGAALGIKNSGMTSQLSTLNITVSQTVRTVIAFMLNWKYDTEYGEEDIRFTLSPDFNPTPIGADWLRLATEWYETGKLPRSAWLELLKVNDMLPSDYNDDVAQAEIDEDELVAGTPAQTNQLELDKFEEEARITSNYTQADAQHAQDIAPPPPKPVAPKTAAKPKPKAK